LERDPHRLSTSRRDPPAHGESEQERHELLSAVLSLIQRWVDVIEGTANVRSPSSSPSTVTSR
jgi:hypothetical protein